MSAVTRSRQSVMGGRAGTAVATKAALLDKLGAPTYSTPSADEKVTIGWVFNTPRGPAEVRDYWWNGATEWSIAAPSRRAAMWLCRYLRRMGIPASTLYYRVDQGGVPRRAPC
jgi:hypothetical protein